jgi:integrase
MKHNRGKGRVYKQPGSKFFWIQYYVNGKIQRESSGSEKIREAQNLLTERINDANKGKPSGLVTERLTLNDLCKMIRDEYQVRGRKSAVRLDRSLDHLLRYFGGECKALTITTDAINGYIVHRQEQPHRQGSRPANASINRELAALKHAFMLAIRAEKLIRKPYIPMLKESEARKGFLDHAEFVALREALPGYLKDPITFLYLSGWRVGEMKILEWWPDVDKDRTRIHLSPAKSKNEEGRTLPISGELTEVIERAHAQRRLDCPFVFHHDGKPILDFRGAWAKACEAVGRGGLLVHDLRRSSIRNLVRSGISEKIAMELSGHKTRSVFDRYDVGSDEDEFAVPGTGVEPVHPFG